MGFDTFGAVVLAFGFLVPGVIYGSVMKLFTIPISQAATTENLNRFTFSCWNYALWSWQIFRIYTEEWNASRIAIWWFVIIFISPIMWGFIIGLLINNKRYQAFIRWLPKEHVYITATAWDRVWSSTGYGWVGILLKDGSTIYGYWDYDSEASWDVNHRDIYLSEAYEINESGDWIKVPRTAGVIVNGENIVSVQLWNDEPTQTITHQKKV